MKKLTGIIFGAILIACGVLYALSAFGIAEVSFSLDGWWTLFIIVPCLNGLLTGKEKLGSLIGLAVGVLLLLAARGIVDYALTWKLMVPMVIVLLGIKLIVRSVGKEKQAQPVSGESEQNPAMGVFGSENVDFGNEEIFKTKVGAVFGGAKYNLTNANITNNSRIDLMCAFGGVELSLPENVVVENNIFCLFGGVEDKRRTQTANTVTLRLNGYCLFGGVKIK